MILGIVVLLGGIYGGLKEMPLASQDSSDSFTIKSDVSVSDLMSSMNIHQREIRRRFWIFYLMYIHRRH